jgi:eukaryotic-like serine/threonine-protein kinase
MAGPPASRPSDHLIAGQYAVDRAHPVAPVCGLPAFAAADRVTGRTDLIAIQIQRQFPARPRVMPALARPIDGLLAPIAYGSAGDDCYAVATAPPGPNLAARTAAWSELELLECVLRPIAHVLEPLHDRGITHRNIRLDNVFQSAPGQPVVLGVCWVQPPAMAQPALFEPPYSAMCLPAGRGDGSIADDVYALGVLLLCLALGRIPHRQLDDTTMLRRKLELGTFAALAADERLSPIIGDIVRGMLAEDPEHRPTPTLLLDPASARGRRVAARPPRRAQTAITIAGKDVWDARSLAYMMAIAPELGMNALRGGGEQWLRRALGDAPIATRVEELVRHRNLDAAADTDPEAALLMRVITVIDPLAPLCWRGIAVWPDGIGTALAAAMAADADVTTRLQEIVGREEVGNWAALRSDRCDFAELHLEARQQRAWLQQRGQQNGIARLTYLLNPLMPCASPLMGTHWVARLADLLDALEGTAGGVDQRQTEPVDTHVSAFISARLERRLDSEVSENEQRSDETRCLAHLRLLGQLQSRLRAPPLPALASWVATRSGPALAAWRNRERRKAVRERVTALASAGQLAPMLAVLEDPTGRMVDAREAQEAASELRRVDDELAQISNGAATRSSAAVRIGQEIAAGLGLAVLATLLAAAAIG